MFDRTVVCDTTVLLYLGRINQLGLLPALFSEVSVPEQVVTEPATRRNSCSVITLMLLPFQQLSFRDIHDQSPARILRPFVRAAWV